MTKSYKELMDMGWTVLQKKLSYVQIPTVRSVMTTIWSALHVNPMLPRSISTQQLKPA